MIITKDIPQELPSSTSTNSGSDAPPSYTRAADSSVAGPSSGGLTSAEIAASASDSKSASGIFSRSLPFSPPLDGPLSPISPSSSASSYYAPNTFRGQDSEDPNFYSAFSRVPAENLSYASFTPIFLVSVSRVLDKGFPAAPPPSVIRPHPFVSHDVTEEDWLRFLQEIRISAMLTEKDISRSNIPIFSLIPFVSPMARFGVQKFMKSQKKHKVVKVIDTWNHHFFELRKIRIIFMRGRTKLSGASDAPLETSQTTHADGASKSTSTSTDATIGPEVNWDDDLFRLLVVSI